MKQMLIILVVVWLNSVLLFADRVELNNGDRLTGEVRDLSSGKLSLETAYAGTVEIQWDQVETLLAAETFVVEFAGGGSATGSISSLEPGILKIGSTSPIPTVDVITIRKETATRQEPGLLGNWHGSADAGYTFTRGNTEIDNLVISFLPERETAKDRIRVRVRSLYSVQDGGISSERATSSNMHMGQARYDRFLSRRAFVFAVGRIEKDERERLDLRTSEGGGFGIQFQPDSETHVSLFGGVTFLQEDFEAVERRLSAEGLAGVEFETARFGPFLITSKGQLLPILRDGRYRIEWDASIRIPLFGGFTLGLQMFDNFDSNPPRALVKKNDFGVISTVGLTF